MKSNLRIIIFSFAMLISGILNAQSAPFNISIKAVNVPGLGGLQSYAVGQHNGKWLIVGGRLDGLHRRQPWAAFDLAGHNTQLIVVDPISMQKWSAPMSSLPTSIQEQLASTNMEFYQDGNYLYCIGGYGYSASLTDHTTFSNLTAIKVPDVINAIIGGTSFTGFIRQITDPMFQVTGGRLKKIDSTYYLVGGQKFLGRYNPMGPSNGPGFIQEYTNSIRIFTLADNGTTIQVNHLPTYTDSINLHRRDYNAEAQIFPNGNQGITAFSGVFQPVVDLPYLNCVNIDSSGYTVNNAFRQHFNHYHCAVLPLYSRINKEMHNVFFGGIAQFYDSSGVLIQDNNVPFVKTIARVTRDSSGIMTEYKLPIEMPFLLGAGSEFIQNETLMAYSNGVLKLDDFVNDTTMVGYIFGGISSTAANVFFTNNGTQSSASSQIFEVSLIKNKALGIHELNKMSINTMDLRIFPNPNHKEFKIEFLLKKSSDVKISISSIHGEELESDSLSKVAAGKHVINKRITKELESGVYLLIIETDYEKTVKKMIIED